MTAEMLLQYAHHPNRDLRKTYQERIVTELLRTNKGLLSTEDLTFDAEFSETTFFEILSQKAYATFGSGIKNWNIYFEIIRRIGQGKPIVIKQVIGLYKKILSNRVKILCLDFLRQQPGIAFEGEIMAECLSLPLDLNLFDLAVKNCLQVQKGMSDIIEVLKKYPTDHIKYKLDIIEKLPAGLSNWNIGAVAIMLIKGLLDTRIDKKVLRNRIENLLIKQFEIIVSLNNNLVICKRFAEVYARGQISSFSYLKIIELVLDRRDKNDSLFLAEALKGLYKVLNDGNKHFAAVYQILKQVFLWPEEELRILALQNLSLIFKEHHDNKTFMKEFLIRFKNLYISNGLAVVNKADGDTFVCLCDFWKKINPQILNLTLQVMPPDLKGQFLSYRQ